MLLYKTSVDPLRIIFSYSFCRSLKMMRVNFKTILLLLIIAGLSSLLTSWNYCGNSFFLRNADWKSQLQHKVSGFFLSEFLNGSDFHLDNRPINFNRLIFCFQDKNNELGYQEIDCNINGGYSIGCRKEGDEVYIPFSFIHKYFEVNKQFHFALTMKPKNI